MSSQSPQLYLSPEQQDLLMAALNSNQPAPARSGSRSASYDAANASDLFESPSDNLNFDADDSYPGFDADGEFDDNYEYDAAGQQTAEGDERSPSSDLHEKRKSVDGKDEDDEGGGKRREGEDKSGKKPGRKPLTSEPTSKRKAQNRAAQRAFRERKEKHLKDLESKVEELEKASESTNHENGLLRAQVERLQVELKEYRKRLSWVSSNGISRPQQSPTGYGSQMRNNNAFNDFQFEFPKFGDLPAMPSLNGSASKQQSDAPARSSTLPTTKSNKTANVAGTRNSMSSASPTGQAATYGSTENSPYKKAYSASPPSQQRSAKPHNDSIDSLSGLFSPSILEASRKSAFGYFPPQSATNATQPARSSFDNGLGNNTFAMYASSSNTDSPASSSDAHHQTSSIGTSPEPSLSSPGQKLGDFGLNPINENQVSDTFGSATSGFDTNGINWLAQQNGGAFDPILFGDYRESQDAVVTQDFGSFFNDAFPLPDLGSPQHNFNDLPQEPAPKVDLLDQVDAARDGLEEVVPGEDRAKLMTCNKIWDRLQSMEKFRNGEIDVDNLCSELRAKARCSEGGAVVEEKDVDRILSNAK